MILLIVQLDLSGIRRRLKMSVGGILGADTHDAFWLVVLGLLGLGIGEFTLTRWLRCSV